MCGSAKLNGIVIANISDGQSMKSFHIALRAQLFVVCTYVNVFRTSAHFCVEQSFRSGYIDIPLCYLLRGKGLTSKQTCHLTNIQHSYKFRLFNDNTGTRTCVHVFIYGRIGQLMLQS